MKSAMSAHHTQQGHYPSSCAAGQQHAGQDGMQDVIHSKDSCPARQGGMQDIRCMHSIHSTHRHG
jgi:hypothetical protein